MKTHEQFLHDTLTDVLKRLDHLQAHPSIDIATAKSLMNELQTSAEVARARHVIACGEFAQEIQAAVREDAETVARSERLTRDDLTIVIGCMYWLPRCLVDLKP